MSALAGFERLNIGKLQKINAQKEAAYTLAGRYRSRLTNSNRNKLINKFFSNNISINNAARAINNTVPPGTFRTRPGRFRKYLEILRSANNSRSTNTNTINKMIRKEQEIGRLFRHITRNGGLRASYKQRLANIRLIYKTQNRLRELEILLRNMNRNAKRSSPR